VRTGLLPQKLLLWWPVAAILLLLILGWAVRTGPTAIDIWFQHSGRPWWRLLYLSDEKVLLAGLLVAALGAGYRRRWAVAVLMVAVPIAAVSVIRPMKLAFGRLKDDALCYPSGHTTLLVATLGMIVFGFGATLWRIAAAVIYCLLGAFGLSATYHYFTDTSNDQNLWRTLGEGAWKWAHLPEDDLNIRRSDHEPALARWFGKVRPCLP